MEIRILRILVVTAIFASGGDAIPRRNSIAHRYGGGSGYKRPPPGGRPGGYASANVAPSGGGYGSFGPPAANLGYGPAGASAVGAYGSGGYSSSYNAPVGGYVQANNYGGVGGHGQSGYTSPSVSYSRPFGLPEGQKFPHGGFTYRFPEQKPPLPPVKSSYKSKPYPDFIVRFKSPLYPSEVSVFNKPQFVRPQSLPPVGGPPVYEPGETPEAFGANKLQGMPPLNSMPGINVGASYQTGGGQNPVYGTGIQLPPSVIPNSALLPGPPYADEQTVVLPPSTSIYLFKGEAVASDKFQMDSFESQASSNGSALQSGGQNAFIELSKDAAFGNAGEPGIIKPLTPDVVYSPNEKDDFKPMYIFGPVYFPKTDTGEATSASETNVPEAKSPAGAASAVSECTEADSSNPQCNLKTSGASQTAQASTTVAPPSTAADVEPKAPSTSDSKHTTDDVEDDEDEDAAESGGGRGLIGVLKGILGVDDSAVEEEEEHFSRADKKKSSNKGKSRPANDEDEGDEQEPSSSKRRRPSLSSTRYSDRYRKGSSKSSPRGSSSRKKSSGSSLRPSDSRSQSDTGVDQPPELLDTAEEKKQTDREKTDSHAIEPSEPSGMVPEQSIEGPVEGGQQFPPNENLDELPDPVVGPVQIGYIGGPPPNSPYSPYQPFFYPAGVPAYGYNPLGPDSSGSVTEENVGGHEADHTMGPSTPSNADGSVADTNVRRNFHGSDGSENFIDHVDQSGDNARPNDDNTHQVIPNDGNEVHIPEKPDGMFKESDSSPVGTPEFEDARSSLEPQGQGHDSDSSGSQNDHSERMQYGSSLSQDIDTGSQPTTEYALHATSDTTHGDDSSSVTTHIQDGRDHYHEDHVTYDHPTSSLTTSSLHVTEHVSNDPFLASDGSSANEAVGPSSKNDVTEESHTISSTLHEYSSSSSETNDDMPISTLKSYQSLDDHGEASSIDSSTIYDKHSYASVTRRPFPSFYRYRTSYRPRDSNYVAPTTYRPAFRLSSASDKEDLAEVTNGGSTVPSSDQDVLQSLHRSVTPVSNIIEPFHLDTANSEALVQVHEVTDAPYGSRIGSKTVQ